LYVSNKKAMSRNTLNSLAYIISVSIDLSPVI